MTASSPTRLRGPGLRQAIATLSLLLLVVGCAGRPSADLAGARITELTTEHVGLTFDVRVTNPWLVPLPLAEAAGSLSSPRINNGTPFLNLEGGDLGSVPSQGSLTVPLHGRFIYAPVIGSLGSLAAGDEVPYEARLKLTAGVPLTGEAVNLPEIRHGGKLPILALPTVSVKRVSWPTLGWDRVTGTLTLGIRNNNAFSIGPGQATGKVFVKSGGSGDGQAIADIASDLAGSIAGKSDGELSISISFDPRTLFSQNLWSGLSGALSNPGSLRVAGTLNATTPYIPVSLTFDTK